MPLSSFQSEVAKFVSKNNLQVPVGDRMLDLTSEVGELAKEILISTGYGKQNFYPTEAWADELGDVFFSLVCLANTTDVDLSKSLGNAITKYQARLNHKGDAGSSNHQT